MHNQSYPDIIQAYSSIFKTLCKHCICRIAVYLNPWHIHHPCIFRTPYIRNAGIFLNSGAGNWFSIFAFTIDAFSCFCFWMCLHDMLSSIWFLEWSVCSFKSLNRVFSVHLRICSICSLSPQSCQLSPALTKSVLIPHLSDVNCTYLFISFNSPIVSLMWAIRRSKKSWIFRIVKTYFQKNLYLASANRFSV